MRNPSSTATEDAASTWQMSLVTKLAQDLSSGKLELPSFPDVVVQIRKVLADKDADVERIARVVGTEPALAARVLRLANSAAVNPSGKPVTDLPTAITRMGIDMVRSAALSFAIAQIRAASKCRPIATELKDLWERATLVAAVSRALASEVSDTTPDEAMLVGLLHSIGQLYILTRAVGNGPIAGNEARLATVMQDWHANIGKAVLESWDLPEEICDAVGSQDEMDEQRRAGPVTLAELLTTALALSDHVEDPPGLEKRVAGSRWFASMRLDLDTCQAVLSRSSEDMLELRRALG